MKGANLKKLPNIFHKTQHTTHLLKLVDKCKYEMDAACIVDADTILSTDGQMGKVKPVYPSTLLSGDILKTVWNG